MKGTVIKSTGSWYNVVDEQHQHVLCRTRGKLRLDDSHETNPIAVGDHVVFETEGKNGVITEILERKNHMLRQSVKKSSHTQVLAANVDQVLLLATSREPRTSTGFIDRFLTSAESFRIPQIILFNKSDLLSPEEKISQQQLISVYNSLNIHTESISALEDELSPLISLLSGKVTLLAGHSGAGKSTLLNKIAPGVTQSVGRISEFSQKGTHTTTFAEMFPLAENTSVIDTPGVKEWGLVDMDPQEISDYFIEMRDLRQQCKYGSRCLHITEPACAVISAVERGRIAATRYKSYLSILEDEDNRK